MLKRQHTWQTPNYAVSFEPDGRLAWVGYTEHGRTLMLRAEWSFDQEGPAELIVEFDERVYFPPDYESPVPEARVAEIQRRVSVGLDHFGVPHSFIRLGRTSL